MSKIKDLRAMEILDSRGNPTLEVSCEFEDGTIATDSVPSGASTGVHEAMELRDGDQSRYNGLGVLKAVNNVNEEIKKMLVGNEFTQKELDDALINLDGTKNKSRLGANAILGVSISFARASASSKKTELFKHIGKLYGNNDFKLPIPMLNVINGGKHADSGLDIQEFLLVPIGLDSFNKKIQAGDEIIKTLKNILEEKGYAISVGDEGGFAPKLEKNEDAIQLIEEAIKKSGYSYEDFKISLDAASSTFFKENEYHLKISGKEEKKNSDGMIAWYSELCKKYPIFSIEDGLREDDWIGFEKMTKTLAEKIKIVGDDLTVTNTERIKKAIENKAVNAVIIKLNQIGTLTETLEAIRLAKNAGWSIIISHRSGDTLDTFISDLSVGVASEFIKSGSLTREERVCKYNRLMEIEKLLS